MREAVAEIRATHVPHFMYEDLELGCLFEQLVEQWYSETAHISDARLKILHPAHQRIIGLGRQVLPLLLKELHDRPGHWFWALRVIAGEDPAKQGDDMNAATQAWIEWGVDRGYVSGEHK